VQANTPQVPPRARHNNKNSIPIFHNTVASPKDRSRAMHAINTTSNPLPSSPLTTLACLEMAHQLATPQAVIHIGARNGHGPLHRWQQWSVEYARVIDSDESQLQWLTTRPSPHASISRDWQACVAIVTDIDSEKLPLPCGITTNERQQLAEEEYRLAEWAHTQRSLPIQRLDTLLREHPLPPPATDKHAWLIIDCLDAMAILRGASNTLCQISVVYLRTTIDSPNHTTQDESLAAVAKLLHLAGFNCLCTSETNTPNVAEALFVRNERIALNQALEKQTRLASERNNQIEQLTQAKITAEKLALDRDTQITTLKSQIETLLKEKSDLNQALEKQTRLASERNNQIDSITRERDGLKEKLADLQHRQQLMEQEMNKAEIQIELIKELIISESDLNRLDQF
jgi:DNA-binding transcriptional regulator YdaS (Cro superfamily)